MPPNLLTPQELADALSASYGDVLQWTKRGLIPSIRAGRRHFYVLTQVTKALRERQRKALREQRAPELETVGA